MRDGNSSTRALQGRTSSLFVNSGSCAANKPFRFSKHSGPEINFPLTPSQAARLSNSNAVSPFLESDRRVVVRQFLPLPTHLDPGLEEFEDIVDFQIARKNGDLAAETWTSRTDGYDMDEASQTGVQTFKRMADRTHRTTPRRRQKIDRSIIPGKTNAEFVDGPVLLLESSAGLYPKSPSASPAMGGDELVLNQSPGRSKTGNWMHLLTSKRK